MSSTALIIEDDQDTATLFSHILEFIGFHTEIVPNPERVITTLDRTLPDIILLDIRLGQNISGLNILDYIRGSERFQNCRVIVITGYPNLAESIQDKADLVLLKPISAKQLSTLVLRMVPNHVSENFLWNASHDPVTGLMNRARFKDRLNHAVSRKKRVKDLAFALILIELKEYNTLQRVLGQGRTNQLLEKFAEQVARIIREVDTFSRLAGDRFSILLEDISSPENARTVADRIHAIIATPIQFQDKVFKLNASIMVIEEDFIQKLEEFLKDSP